MVTGDLINTFVDASVVDAMNTLLSSNDENQLAQCSALVTGAFLDSGTDFDGSSVATGNHLLNSFKKNAELLIQKTWVEKDDVALKEQVLYKLNQMYELMEAGNWHTLYPTFREIIIDIVYLMFGAQSKSKDFDEYALRIDPEFGIFWWYFTSLPENVDWDDKKCYYILLIGVQFLANY